MSKAIVETVETVRGFLEAFVSGAIKVAEEHMKLQEKRGGTYVNGVRAAILSGNKETFEKEVTSFMDDIRANKEGIARKLGCKVAKRQPKDAPKNRPVYVVPSAVSALKTYMTQAFEFGVALVGEDGETPRAYSAIREDVNTIKADNAKKALTGDDKARAEIGDLLDQIDSKLDKLSGDALLLVQVKVKDALMTARDQWREANKVRVQAEKALREEQAKSKKEKAKKAKAKAKKAKTKAPKAAPVATPEALAEAA